MVLSRLAQLATRRRARAPIILIDSGGPDAGMWQPIPQAQGQGGGLAPMPQTRGARTVASRAPRHQPTLADLVVKYGHLLSRVERKTRAHFEVTATDRRG